jgi:hypothetical protein
MKRRCQYMWFVCWDVTHGQKLIRDIATGHGNLRKFLVLQIITGFYREERNRNAFQTKGASTR